MLVSFCCLSSMCKLILVPLSGPFMRSLSINRYVSIFGTLRDYLWTSPQMNTYLTLDHLWKIYDLDETWDKVVFKEKS